MPHSATSHWRQLADQLQRPFSSPPPSDECQHCLAALPRFIADELANLPVDALYGETAVHLDICPTCLAEYEALVQLATAAFYLDEELK